ncbi:MAG: NUDIX hydrolase [Candidatus Moraniibacteriota bacterium]
MKRWKRSGSEIVYDSRYFRVRKDAVELHDGIRKEWTYWDSADSAMTLGMTEEKKLVMIRQYRYLVDDVVIEFPSGTIEAGESEADGARREFEEETGYVCGTMTELGSFYETYGQLNRKIHIFFSEGVMLSDHRRLSTDDVSEETEVVLVGVDEAVRLALENKIAAMGSSLAILLLKSFLQSDRDMDME